MRLHIIPTNDDANKAAIAYGPIVLAGVMGTAGISDPAPYSNPLKYNDYYTYNYLVPDNLSTSLQLEPKKLANYLEPVPGKKMTFKTVKEGIVLKPLFDIHRERYVVYWDVENHKK